MFESNFPVDHRQLRLRILWNAFKRLAAGYSAEEKTALFSGTARARLSSGDLGERHALRGTEGRLGRADRAGRAVRDRRDRVRGQPMRVYKNAPPTVRDLWLSSAPFAEREYLIYEDERITYAEAHRAGGRHRRLAGDAGRAARRPRGDRHAQLSRMDADLLGVRLPWASPPSA